MNAARELDMVPMAYPKMDDTSIDTSLYSEKNAEEEVFFQ